MKDLEVYRRAKEVEKELQEMRNQWVNMHELITKMMEDTYVREEKDYSIDYSICINCEHHDIDKNGISCMILQQKDKPCYNQKKYKPEF